MKKVFALMVAILASSFILTGCNMDAYDIGQIIPGWGRIVSTAIKGSIRDKVLMDTTWESTERFQVPGVVLSTTLGVRAEMFQAAPLLSYAVSFSTQAQLIKQANGYRFRIPIAVSNPDPIIAISSMKAFSVEVKILSRWYHNQLRRPIGQWPEHFTFYMLDVRSRNMTFFPEDWNVRILASGSVEKEWCQAAIGGGFPSPLFKHEKDLITEHLQVVQVGYVWTRKFYLNLTEKESIPHISILWKTDNSTTLLITSPGNALYVPLIKASLPGQTGEILIYDIRLEREPASTLAAPGDIIALLGEPIVKDGLATWKGKNGGSVSIPSDILESGDISNLILEPLSPEGKKTISWGWLKGSN